MLSPSTSARLPVSVKLGWAFGETALATHMAIISIYLLFYLTDVHHVPAAWAGMVLLLPRIWNVVTDPLMGTLSDKTVSRWGRRRPYLLVGALVWGTAFAAMFCLPRFDDPIHAAIAFCAVFLVVNTGLSLYHVPYSAMAPELTGDYRERLSLVAYKEVVARLAVLLAIAIPPLLIKWAKEPLQGHRLVGMVFGGLIVLSGLVTFVATRAAPSSTYRSNTTPWREQWRTLLQNRPLALLCGAYFMTNIADAAFGGMLIYFIVVVAKHDAAIMGVLYPLGSLTSVLVTPLWAKLGALWGKRATCLVAYGGLCTCWLCFLVVPCGWIWPLYLIMLMHGFFNAGEQLLPSAMVPDTIEFDEYHTGLRREGAIYGAWVFVQQTGMAFGSFVIGGLLGLLGYHGAQLVNSTVEHGIRFSAALLPTVFVVVAGLLVMRYRLSAKEFERIQEHLLLRRRADSPHPVPGA